MAQQARKSKSLSTMTPAQKKRMEKQSDDHPVMQAFRMMNEAEKNDPRLVELLKASRAGDVAQVRRLVKSGLSPNEIAPGDFGQDTAVTAALFARKPAVLRLLGELGADLDDGFMYKPLVTAAEWGNSDLVQALL